MWWVRGVCRLGKSPKKRFFWNLFLSRLKTAARTGSFFFHSFTFLSLKIIFAVLGLWLELRDHREEWAGCKSEDKAQINPDALTN